MDKQESFNSLKQEIYKYYSNKIEDHNSEIEGRVKSLFADLEGKANKKCHDLLNRLTAVSEKHVDITPEGTVTRFLPKAGSEGFKEALSAYEDCANQIYLNIDGIAMLKEQFKTLNQKGWEKCSANCEKKLTDLKFTIDGSRNCLLSCVNLMRFNFKSYAEIINEDIDNIYKEMNTI
jgi:hypothetical protein